MKTTSLWCLCLALLIASATAQTARKSKTAPTTKASGPVQTEKSKIAATALNDFGLKLATGAAARNPNGNLFVSPLSVFVALTMAETGADGQTRAAMRHALSVPAGVREDTLHQATSALLKSLNSQQGVELSIANALWSDPSLPLSPRFVQQSKELYAADARTLDFRSAGAADVINEWVKEKTHGKIPDIVSPEVVRVSKAMLTNAVYFRGKWSVPFPKDATQPATFHLADGHEKQAPMMHLGSFQGAYRAGEGYEAAALGYESSTIKLFAILPAPGKTPENILAKLSIKNLLAPASPADLNLSLPRFTLEFSYKLKDQLEQMGMGVAFRPDAEFAPMGSRKFYIGDVLHKTRVEVDEEGTVAAAATAVQMKALSAMRPRNPKTLVFDRPFAVVLCDAVTGAILFAGVVYDPAP
jgi:serine protease inhibitor